MARGIKFACPHCKRGCKVPVELAGKQGRCPGCSKVLEVPLATPENLSRGTTSRTSRIDEEDDEDPDTTTAEIDLTKQACPKCKLEIDKGVAECPYCHEVLVTPDVGIPWTIIAALICFLPASLPGLVLAQFGLKEARKRGAHEGLAWVAVFLNGVFLVFGTLWMLKGMVK